MAGIGDGGYHSRVMRIREPTTTLTDYVLAVECLVFAGLLLRGERADWGTEVLLWAAGFGASAVAAAVGGSAHGWVDYVTLRVQRALWLVSMGAIGLASACFTGAVVWATFADPVRRWLLAALGVEVLVYWVWIARDAEFRWAVYLYGGNMLAVLAILALAIGRGQVAGAGWIVAAVLVGFAGAAIQRRGLAPHPRFNHNDLYHVIQMLAFYLLFRGAQAMVDGSG